MSTPPVRAVLAHQPWAARRRRRVFLPVVGMVLAAVSALAITGLATSGLPSDAVVVSVALSLIPVVVVVGAFLWLDRWEPEPGPVLLAAFLWGAGVATLGAVVVNSIVGMTYGAAAASVVSAPMVEEGLKGVFVVGLLWWHSREFDGVVDGLVYAGLVGAGFAFVENVLYLANAFTAGASEGLVTFVARGVITPFAHPLFTAFIGIGVGMAARRTGVVATITLPLVGYLPAVTMHALWNASALWDGGRGFLPTYVSVMVPIFLGMLGLALWQRRREQRIVAALVPAFAQAGWVAWSEVALLSTMSGRRRWRRAVRRQSGPAAARAVREYQNAVTELAFLADRLRRGTAGSEAAAMQRHDEVLDAVVSARQRAVGAAA